MKNYIGHIFLLWLLPCCAWGQHFVHKAGDEGDNTALYYSTYCYIDSFSVLALEDVLSPAIQGRFRLLDSLRLIDTSCKGWQGKNCPSVWLKRTIRNPFPNREDFFLCSYFYNGDYETIYFLHGQDSVEIKHAGIMVPLSKLSLQQQLLGKISRYNKSLVPVTLAANDSLLVYSKINHYSSNSIGFHVRLYTQDFFWRHSKAPFRLHSQGLFLTGMVLMIALFNFCIFLLNRQIAFLWLACYNLCIAVVFVYLSELNAYIFTEHPVWAHNALTLSEALIPGVYGLFIYHFLDIPKTLPRLVPIFKFGIWSSFALSLCTVVYFTVSNKWHYWDDIVATYDTILLAPLLVFIYFAFRQKKAEYYFFLTGSGFLLLSAAAYLLYTYAKFRFGKEFGYLLPDLPILDVFQYGLLAEVLTFAAGLGYKMMNAEKEKIRLATLDEVKGKLYTNITHEFRTPLTVIMGVADNIGGHEQERRLIRRNSKNLLRLINQLLDLSKLDSGTMKMDLVQGDAVNYLRYLTESFYSLAQEKKIALTFCTEVPELVMDFDEVKIQHIVYNLLSNAIKFTGAGGTVLLHLQKKERNGKPWLQLRVKDTGAGIPESQFPHIFDRFYQADNSTTRKGEGTGIGLTLTKELVQMMGGSITVKSELGMGTEFVLLIPVNTEANTTRLETGFQTSKTLAPELVPDLPTAQSSQSNDSNNLKQIQTISNHPQLLIIEDNADVASYIENLLRKDYQITTARNGQEGIDMALEAVPDIIISDVMMPEKDGFEVCGILKQDMRTSHIPIILLTAKAEQQDKVTGLKHGADAYLMKPFDKEELFVRLEKLVELRRALQERYSSPQSSVGSRQSLGQREVSRKFEMEDRFLEQLREAAESVMGDPENAIANLEKAMQLSQMQLYRKLKALTGKTPSLYIRSVRLQKARHLLETTSLNVSEIAYDVGFTDPAYFSRAFSEEFGTPPSAVRN